MGARSVPEGIEKAPPELQAIYDKRMNEINSSIIEKVAQDSDFGQRLAQNPRETLDAAGFGQRFEALRDELKGEVSGHAHYCYYYTDENRNGQYDPGEHYRSWWDDRPNSAY